MPSGIRISNALTVIFIGLPPLPYSLRLTPIVSICEAFKWKKKLYDLTTIMVYRYMNSPAVPKPANWPPRAAPRARPPPLPWGGVPRGGAIRGGIIDERQSVGFKNQSGCSWETWFKRRLAGQSFITKVSERSEFKSSTKKITYYYSAAGEVAKSTVGNQMIH